MTLEFLEITEFALVRPGSKNPIISRITYKKVKETIFRNFFFKLEVALILRYLLTDFSFEQTKKARN